MRGSAPRQKRSCAIWCGVRCPTRLEAVSGVHPPALLYEYQNKGLANWVVRKCMKTKDSMEGCQEVWLDPLVLEVVR